ncbi:MAG: alpha/beta fold hydrolase [Acidobacteriota bacterium]
MAPVAAPRGLRLIRGFGGALGRLAPGPASSLARHWFLSPPRRGVPTREAWWATDGDAFGIPAAGGTLAAWSWGWGPKTVVLVHGWGGRGLQLGAFAAPLVEAGFRVVAFDAPGHGQSPGRSSSLPAMASAVERVVGHLERVDGAEVHGVMAHSFGAAAVTLALARSSAMASVGRLVFLAPPADLRSLVRRFGALTGFPEPVVHRMRRSIEGRFGIVFDELGPKVLAPQVGRPLLIVHDRGDTEIPWRDGATLARAWPGALLRSTRGLGHFRLLRDSSVVGLGVDFLAEAAADPE